MVRSRPGKPNPFYTENHTRAVFASPSGRLLHKEVSEDTAVEALKEYDGEGPITQRWVIDLSNIHLEEYGDYTMRVTCSDGGTVVRHLAIE